MHVLLAELTRTRHRSSTSEDLELQQHPVPKKSLSGYMTLKMDLLAQDLADLHSESDPEVMIIKLLYAYAYATIADLLKPHLKAVKKAAARYHRLSLHHMAVGEDIIESADSIGSLMSRMSVGGMWDNTHFLSKAIASIPQSAPERGIAEAVLSHYNQNLAIYKRATLLKDDPTSEPESKEEVEASTEAKKLVPLKITCPFDSVSGKDCHNLQARGSAAFGIPEEKTTCCDVKECQTFDG